MTKLEKTKKKTIEKYEKIIGIIKERSEQYRRILSSLIITTGCEFCVKYKRSYKRSSDMRYINDPCRKCPARENPCCSKTWQIKIDNANTKQKAINFCKWVIKEVSKIEKPTNAKKDEKGLTNDQKNH